MNLENTKDASNRDYLHFFMFMNRKNHGRISMNKNIKNLGNTLLKKKVYILLITLIFMITGIAYTLTNIKYVASQKFLVRETGKIETYKEILKGSTALEKVIGNLGIDLSIQEFSSLMEVNKIEEANMLEMKISGEDGELIKQLFDETSKVFLETVQEIYENPEIFEVDTTASYAKQGNVVLVGVASLLIGFVLACLLFAIEFLLDTKVKTSKDIEEITGLKSLISIPNIKMIAKKKLNIKNIRAHKSEIFKVLMTNIQFVNANHLQSKSILITSSNAMEGKTYVATNLAIEFAKAGKKVILIDADMRKGRIAKIFNLPNDLGFSNYLSHLDSNGNVIHEIITRFINDTEIKNLSVITSGNIPPNPVELLQKDKVKELIKDLKVFYDVIIFDTVSLLEAPETKELSQICELSLILSSYGKTKKEQLLLAYEQLNRQEGSCIGMAFNKIPDTKLKKEIIILKINTKKRMNKILKGLKSIFRKVIRFFKQFAKIGSILKSICLLIIAGIIAVKNLIFNILQHAKRLFMKGVYQLKNKTKGVKEYIQKYKNQKEETKLIEAAKDSNYEEKNIIRDVFEEQIAKIEGDEIEYRKKLDLFKANIETRANETSEVKPVIIKPESQEKSKFDLIREQQKKDISENKIEVKENLEPEEKNIEIENPQKKTEVEQLEIKVEEVKSKQEDKKSKMQEIQDYEEIDLSKQEQITEEMIRRQVEIDEMVRLAEKEEEEENLRIRRLKQDEKEGKRKERQEKIKNFWDSIKPKKEEQDVEKEKRIRKMEAKIERRIKRENEKMEKREKAEKIKEEKRAYREIEKQRHKEELRIQEELQEDNLYPRPRI